VKVFARLLVVCVAALVLAAVGSVKAAPAVGACGFTQEQYVETTSLRSDPTLGSVTLHESVQTENNGCGTKHYVVYQYFTRGTAQVYPSGYYATFVRVWVCGAYQGTWQNLPSTPSIVVSPDFFYGTCGRQADNQSSFFHDNGANANWSAYRNQG
jgi:hypothetical protein